MNESFYSSLSAGFSDYFSTFNMDVMKLEISIKSIKSEWTNSWINGSIDD